jgi:hypothetical protein
MQSPCDKQQPTTACAVKVMRVNIRIAKNMKHQLLQAKRDFFNINKRSIVRASRLNDQFNPVSGENIASLSLTLRTGGE